MYSSSHPSIIAIISQSIHPSIHPCPCNLCIHPSSILPVVHAIAVSLTASRMHSRWVMDLCVGQSYTDDIDFKDVPGKSSPGSRDGRLGACFGLCDAAQFVQACSGIACLYRLALALWDGMSPPSRCQPLDTSGGRSIRSFGIAHIKPHNTAP